MATTLDKKVIHRWMFPMFMDKETESPDLAKKHWYQELVREQWDKAVFISLDELQELHRIHNPKCYQAMKSIIKSYKEIEGDYPSVAYVLGAGIATGEDYCCNGIRYGADGEYVSLIQLPACVWN